MLDPQRQQYYELLFLKHTFGFGPWLTRQMRSFGHSAKQRSEKDYLQYLRHLSYGFWQAFTELRSELCQLLSVEHEAPVFGEIWVMFARLIELNMGVLFVSRRDQYTNHLQLSEYLVRAILLEILIPSIPRRSSMAYRGYAEPRAAGADTVPPLSIASVAIEKESPANIPPDTVPRRYGASGGLFSQQHEHQTSAPHTTDQLFIPIVRNNHQDGKKRGRTRTRAARRQHRHSPSPSSSSRSSSDTDSDHSASTNSNS